MHGELVLDTQHFEHGDDIDERDFGTDTTITHALRSSSSDVQVRPISARRQDVVPAWVPTVPTSPSVDRRR